MPGDRKPLGPDKRLFVLTGAGISAESGLPTFRGVGGLWRGHRVEAVASPEAFARDPELVWTFYSERRAQARSARPNAGHLALAWLESRLEDRLFLCTQNVDPLHDRAGSRNVAAMHGRLFQSRCSDPRCGSEPFEDEGLYRTLESIPHCAFCGARVRPHICWFGEVPFEMDRVERELLRCDLCLVVGTSGVVYPAAAFASLAAARGARTIYAGPEVPGNAAAFHEIIQSPATTALPTLARSLAGP